MSFLPGRERDKHSKIEIFKTLIIKLIKTKSGKIRITGSSPVQRTKLIC